MLEILEHVPFTNDMGMRLKSRPLDEGAYLKNYFLIS